MKLAYLAAPYRADTIHGVVTNIRNAENDAISLWQMGFAVLAPQKNTALLDGLLPDDVWLEGALEMLSRCDLAVFAGEWRRSEGCLAEFKRCGELGIPRYDYIGDYLAIKGAV